MRLARSLCLLLAMLLCLPASAHAGDRVALVIGVSGYRSIPSLANPSRDAAAVAAALRGVGFEVTQLNQPAQLTRDAIGTALVRFRAQAERAEAAIIYFAGHGVEVNGSNWLLPADVMADSPDDLEVKAIPASSAINAVRGASTIRLVILDACRDNPFAANPGWASGRRAVTSRGLGREMGRADNVVLLLATQPGTRASDGMGAANSPFAKALAGALASDGMQIAELPTMVARRMQRDDRVEQRPDQQGIFDEPRWMFRAGNSAGSAPPLAPVPLRPAPQRPAAAAMITPVTRPRPVANAAALIRECDRLAAAEANPMRPADAPFVAYADILPVLAIPACTRAVEVAPDNGRLMFQLGRANGKNEDHASARQWYEQAAAKGNAGAMNNIGSMYLRGNGVAQDYAEARRWFEQAAAKGEPTAMGNLGSMYSAGTGVVRDYTQARRWHEQAAAKGNVAAMTSIGVLYHKGLGLAQDYAQARRWYEQAAAKGEPFAMTYLGLLYHNASGVPQDYAQARRWYEQAAAKGDDNAMTYLGLLFRDSLGGAQDYARARRLFEQAAAMGNSEAMTDLGALYSKGLGVTQDFAVARRWYEQAAAKGEPYAMNNLGVFYHQGSGVEKDMAQARRWYEQAAAKGHEGAKKWLAANPQ